MSTKKNVLIFGILGTLFIAALSLLDTHSCYISETCTNIRRFLNQDISSVIFVAPVLLLISLFTLFLKEEVFQSWWRFAKWIVPILMFFSYVLNGSGGGSFGIGNGSFILIWLFYIIFTIVSFAIIIRATYRAAGQ